MGVLCRVGPAGPVTLDWQTLGLLLENQLTIRRLPAFVEAHEGSRPELHGSKQLSTESFSFGPFRGTYVAP